MTDIIQGLDQSGQQGEEVKLQLQNNDPEDIESFINQPWVKATIDSRPNFTREQIRKMEDDDLKIAFGGKTH